MGKNSKNKNKKLSSAAAEDEDALLASAIAENQDMKRQIAVAETACDAAAPPPDGTYARYKHYTNLVHKWCDALVGVRSATLKDWAIGMSSLAARGEKMPAEVRNSLDVAIALRDEANAFYRAIAAAEAQQRRHWYVCRLLRQFRRLFSPRKAAQPAASAEEPPASDPASRSLGFEVLGIEDTNEAFDDDDVLDVTDGVDSLAAVAATSTEDDGLDFALACLMADAARAREDLRRVWAAWAPADDHGAALLGATSQAAFIVTKLERAVNATQLMLGLPDTNLSTLVGSLTPPRVRLRGLQAKPELNGQCGELRGRDAQSGRYLVALDGADAEAPPVKAKALNICGEYAWEERADALVGILQQVGRALADFDHAHEPPTCTVDCHPDPSVLLDKYVSGGTLWQWTNYARGIGNYGASETLWRRHMRAFVAQRATTKGSREVSFIVAFMVAAAVETTAANVRRGLDVRPAANGAPVMREMRRLLSDARATLADAPITGHDGLAHALTVSVTALEYSLESEPTVQSCVWLSGDVLDVANRIGAPASLAAKVVWQQKSYVVVMVHLYHALRCTGHLRAIPQVDALLRMFRRSVFFRTEQLPARGSFGKAMALSLGATASSVSNASKGAPELKAGRVLEYTGINPTEWSMLRHVSCFHGAGLEGLVDLEQLDFAALAREEVARLHRAPTLAGVLKLLKVRDALHSAGVREAKVLSAADGQGSSDAAASAVPCWELAFPGCGCTPRASEAAVPLEFSGHTHVDPSGGGLKGAYTSSYAPTTERLSREQLKQRYRDGIAAQKAGVVPVTTW